jgi:hypothetical protein
MWALQKNKNNYFKVQLMMPGFGQGQISKPSLKAMMDNFQLQWTLPFQFLQLQSKVT